MSGFPFDKERERKRWSNFLSVWTEPELALGGTPREAVWQRNKTTLWHYPAREKRYGIPLFLIYSLINRPDILDLQPGNSIIEAFVNAGFDVYLLDFGIPGYEDRHMTIDDYITDHIQTGVQRALRHSRAAEISMIGYCLGGTLAAIYAAIATEPIRNLLLMVTPVDFSGTSVLSQWTEAAQRGEAELDPVIEAYGTMPPQFVKGAVRAFTSPLYFSPYLSLLSRADDEEFVAKWRRFHQWANGHIPFAGAALQQLLHDLGRENKLVKGTMRIRGQRVDLSRIRANLLVTAAEHDKLVPQEQVAPILDLVSSRDQQYVVTKGGHTQLLSKGGLPPFLQEWLPPRSKPIQ